MEQKRTVLITGSNGQLGNELRLLAGKHPRFSCLFTDKDELDICDSSAVEAFVQENEVDVTVNCAAYTAVDRAEDDKELCDRVNHLAPGYLAKAMARRGGDLILISTDYVYDGSSHKPYEESQFPAPLSAYGYAKLCGEDDAIKYCPNTQVIRTAWLYSTFGSNFVKTMLRLGREKESLGVVFDQIGTPTYARDLAEVLWTVLEKGIVPGIFHFSSEGVCSWYDFAKAIFRLAGITSCQIKPLLTREYPTRAERPYYSILDKTKIKETYGIEIPYWEDSLKECIDKLQALSL